MARRGSALSALKQCLLRSNGRQEQHGVAAASLQELRSKACELFAIDTASQPVTLVLAEDGTIVDDEDYFLCLPPNTKFVALAKDEKWACSSIDGGTAWLEGEVTDIDGPESGEEKWQRLARQLKDDLSTIILMSEEDLQALIDVPCLDLARELSDTQAKVQALQETLQQVLDRREEERQSRQLLELYLQAVKNEDHIVPKREEATDTAMEEADTVDAGGSSRVAATVPLSSHILTALREKTAPELSLDSQDLELVNKEDPDVLAQALSWEKTKVLALQEACEQELSRRLQQVQALHSLRSFSKGKKKLPWGEWLSSKRKK
ncbi:DNA fragmentation factor subunit alpha [Anolis carolinensis]|uniref:DNA fragmentation factor subunit alpha n=1 Tax=Anolis carolinensis TaxID=28377 RepID=A0A803TU70_ANOCA|nr:PREDICTED: DNA fragmentation factor subunit alpha [Anolis carolinensis]